MTELTDAPDEPARHVPAPRRRRVGLIRFLLTLELLALGVLGAVPLLLTFPERLGIETFCLFDGPPSPTANAFAIGFAVALVVTGIGTIAYLVARGDRITRYWWLVPPAWLGLLFAAEVVVGLAVGPQECTGGTGWF